MRTASDILPREAASRLAGYKRAVMQAVPGVERLILFGSRARGQAREDSDYDIAVVVHDLPDRRRAGRILSDLAYDYVLSGFFIRPIPLSSDYLAPSGRRPTELAEDIVRDGVEVTSDPAGRSTTEIGLERSEPSAYCPRMDDTPHHAPAPAGWLEALAESEADLAAGRIVPGEVVMKDLRDSLARLEARAAAKAARRDTRQR